MEMLFRAGKNIKLKTLYYCLSLAMLLLGQNCIAETIVIRPNTVVSENKTYNNVTLDMTNGSFYVTNNATLNIKNSIIKGTLSKNNPVLMNVDTGNLNLLNNTVTIKAVNLPPHPMTQSLQYVMQIALGKAILNRNTFMIDQPYAAGLLITTSSIATTGFQITNNTFEKFHGVLYLISSDNALIADNIFTTNSYGNLVSIGNNNKIIHNTIAFSGNDRLGNAMDIIDSNNATISRNILLTPTCHGIYVLNSTNLLIDRNRIHGGITYAMNILSFPETLPAEPYLTHLISQHKMKYGLSSNIKITNNFMSQNRYGIAASDVNGLLITNNHFIQHFVDNDARKFWTDNKTLLTKVTNLTWSNNLYKEAYTQDNRGNNSKAANFVPFPATGGVVL